jgi:hypothetical protein
MNLSNWRRSEQAGPYTPLSAILHIDEQLLERRQAVKQDFAGRDILSLAKYHVLQRAEKAALLQAGGDELETIQGSSASAATITASAAARATEQEAILTASKVTAMNMDASALDGAAIAGCLGLSRDPRTRQAEMPSQPQQAQQARHIPSGLGRYSAREGDGSNNFGGSFNAIRSRGQPSHAQEPAVKRRRGQGSVIDGAMHYGGGNLSGPAFVQTSMADIDFGGNGQLQVPMDPYSGFAPDPRQLTHAQAMPLGGVGAGSGGVDGGDGWGGAVHQQFGRKPLFRQQQQHQFEPPTRGQAWRGQRGGQDGRGGFNGGGGRGGGGRGNRSRSTPNDGGLGWNNSSGRGGRGRRS